MVGLHPLGDAFRSSFATDHNILHILVMLGTPVRRSWVVIWKVTQTDRQSVMSLFDCFLESAFSHVHNLGKYGQ
jgi:hypothetical protein